MHIVIVVRRHVRPCARNKGSPISLVAHGPYALPLSKTSRRLPDGSLCTLSSLKLRWLGTVLRSLETWWAQMSEELGRAAVPYADIRRKVCGL